jgi:predicted enzyme related to lactoylglutathione lyase
MMNQIAAAIGHFDIAGPNLVQLAEFYSRLLGWEVTPRGPGYAQVGTPALRGALVEAPEAAFVVGVIVQDLDAAIAQATSLGGSVIMPTVDNGWVRKAQVVDPAGNLLTLIQK